MKKQPFCSFTLAGVSLTDFGLMIPSPFTSLELANSEITSFTSWTLNVSVTGSDKRKMNISAFEALLYSAAQEANQYANSSGIPVSFMFGWIDNNGNVDDYLSYQGFTNTFNVSTNGLYMQYKLTGFANLAVQKHTPVLRIPSLSGIVQPSAVVEGIAKATKATSYYLLDIDHNDAPTLINHGPLTTSFNSYVRGTYNGQDDYDSFPGLLKLAKSYNASRTAAGIKYGYGKLNTILHNKSVTPLSNFLKQANTDTTPQSASFSYWVDEPTMTSPGVIHFKSNANLQITRNLDVLEYGTSHTNIISVQGSYNGVAYNMTNMKFTQVGFALDGSGNAVSQPYELVNSWSSTLSDVYQSSNIINDVNALASQFSGDFTLQIPGTTRAYTVAQPVSLLIMSGNTISPVTGIYNIVSVTHNISNTFVTTLKVKRLEISSANEVAASQNILVDTRSRYGNNSLTTTKNVKSTHKVDFGTLYPTFEHMGGGDMRYIQVDGQRTYS